MSRQVYNVSTGVLSVINEDLPVTPQSTEELASNARSERSQLFSVVDVVVSNPFRWAELTTTEQAEVATYRTNLLDVPQQTGFPQTVVWPNKPEAL